jgi:hypothetical protein
VKYAEQVAINGSRDVRTLAEQPPVMDLQADRESGNDEKENKEAGHGSNLASSEILPIVADVTLCERKLPSQIAEPELTFSATFCLHSSGAR